MKIIITHQSNSISFDVEENLPEREAFEVLRAFTVSAFENLPDPLVYSLSGASEPFQLQDPKDWKEGLQKHFRGSVICLTVVDPSEESDDDSYVHITDSGDEKIATAEDANPEPIVDEKAEEPLIEDYDSEAELEDKNTDEEVQGAEEEEVEAKEDSQDDSPQSLCKRVKQFIVEIGAESLQNIAAVVHTLVTEGNLNLSDAIRTAVETSEKAANHPLTKDLLAILDVYVQKFQNQFNWHAMLSQFNIDQLVALIPGIVDALTRSMEGAQDVELDISPLMAQFAPMMFARMQSCIPNGEERVFQCNPQNPFAAFEEAREQIAEEFPRENLNVHRGIVCDGCNSAIVGVRYKSVLRSDFDLCETCEKDHDPKDPLIKIKTPVEDMDVLPGLAEFRRSLGGNHRGRRCPRRGGRGRGWCRPRRGCRPCGPGMARMKEMFQNSPIGQHIQQQMAAMQERYCQPQAAAEADHRDPAHQKPEANPVADKKAEVQQKKQEVREAKAKVRALKKEMKACRKEMKKAQKKEKKKKLDGEVTGHLDVDEKSVQQPGTNVLKTWKVKNTGTTVWCEDTIAVFNSGNHSLVVPGYDVIQVGALEPNDVAYIRCMLTVPEVEGTYNVTYRLSGPKGKFGGRLTTEIEVAKPEAKATESTDEKAVAFSSEPGKNIPSVIDLTNEEEEEVWPEVSQPQPAKPSVPLVAPSAPVIPEKKFQWQKQKDQLKAMGFEMDDETLESVLIVSKGDIGQAIQLLM